MDTFNSIAAAGATDAPGEIPNPSADGDRLDIRQFSESRLVYLVYPERLRVSDSIEVYREMCIANLIAAALVVY